MAKSSRFERPKSPLSLEQISEVRHGFGENPGESQAFALMVIAEQIALLNQTLRGSTNSEGILCFDATVPEHCIQKEDCDG